VKKSALSKGFKAVSTPPNAQASGAQDVNHMREDLKGKVEGDGTTPDILDNAYVIVDFENGVGPFSLTRTNAQT
jgi:hypothetical protein